jgi:BirA family biotin operon repressor/biotin-[acetyl-CoA-carboxylase] ligase
MNLIQREKMKIIKLAEINSTNLYAKSNLPDIEDKTVICASKQTNGRGRFDRAWVDLGEDNIFMSIVLKPSTKFEEVYANLTQYFSLVLCETLEEYELSPQIKWPNDVLINGKKIAGILSETVVQGAKFKGLVLGAGINLNASPKDLALITDKEATALNLEISTDHVNKDEFLNRLLEKFFKNYEEFLQNGFGMIEKAYINRTNFLGKEICVQVFDQKKNGIAKALTSNGELVLENKGNEITLTMGDIL